MDLFSSIQCFIQRKKNSAAATHTFFATWGPPKSGARSPEREWISGGERSYGIVRSEGGSLLMGVRVRYVRLRHIVVIQTGAGSFFTRSSLMLLCSCSWCLGTVSLSYLYACRDVIMAATMAFHDHGPSWPQRPPSWPRPWLMAEKNEHVTQARQRSRVCCKTEAGVHETF